MGRMPQKPPRQYSNWKCFKKMVRQDQKKGFQPLIFDPEKGLKTNTGGPFGESGC